MSPCAGSDKTIISIEHTQDGQGISFLNPYIYNYESQIKKPDHHTPLIP